jgi:hypothetical protein
VFRVVRYSIGSEEAKHHSACPAVKQFSACGIAKMSGKEKERPFRDIVEGIINDTRGSIRGRGDTEQPSSAVIRKLIEHDYVRSLRRHLQYRHVRTLLADFIEIFPEFNRRPVEMLSTARFAEIACALRFHIKSTPLGGDDGLALRGFYVASASGLLKHPLIYVNTALHPLAAMTTFLHELGHHRSCSLLSIKHRSLHLFDADYTEHLRDPAELAADVVVSLAGYPETAARKMLTNAWDRGSGTRARELPATAVEEIHSHLGQAYGLDLAINMPHERRLHYLAGMIHFAKLRLALMAEYDL